MQFRLANAPTTFSMSMKKIFYPHLDKFVVVHLDDIMVHNNSMEEHARHLKTVL